MKSNTLLVLLTASLACVSLGCESRGGGFEPIQRPSGLSGRNSNTSEGGLGKLTLQSCDNQRQVLNLTSLTENLSKGSLAQRSARLTLTNFRLLSLSSAPLSGTLNQLSAPYTLRALLQSGLIYDSGRASSTVAGHSLFSVAEQTNCTDVRFASAEGMGETFTINLERSSENQVVLTNPKNEVRIYRVINSNSVEVTSYERVTLEVCGANQEYLLQESVRLDLAEAVFDGIAADRGFARLLFESMDLTTNLEDQVRGQSNRNTGTRTSQGGGALLISDADYIDIAKRIEEDRSLMLLNQAPRHLTLPVCPSGGAEANTETVVDDSLAPLDESADSNDSANETNDNDPNTDSGSVPNDLTLFI